MSRANVEIVRRFYEAWNASDMAACGDLLDPDAIVRPAKGWPEPGPYVGRDAIMTYYEQLRETWVEDTVEPKGEFRYASDHVVIRTAWHTIGQGPPSHLETTVVYAIRSGKIREVEFFWDHDEALEAVGLSE